MMIIHQDANASHIQGADLSYKYVRGQKYIVNYTLYRECSGIPAPSNVNLKLHSQNASFSSFHSLELVPNTGQEISKLCASATTTCAGGNVAAVQEWKYSAEIEIPSGQVDWKMSTIDCCRNATITTISEPSSESLYLEAFLNNSLGPNNSAEFVDVPLTLLNVNQNQIIRSTATDADGDVLVYSMVSPKTGESETVNFLSPYHATNPFGTEMVLNNENGEIQLKPMQSVNGVIAVSVAEYRNGILIGTITRDMQMNVQLSSNSIPSITGINGSTSYSINACAGSTISFDIFSQDADAAQQVSLTWTSNIPDAQVSLSSGSNPSIHFNWNPSKGIDTQVAYFFTVTAQDDACPMNASTTQTFSITVSDINLDVQSTHVSCPDKNDGQISTMIAGGNAPYKYSWSGSDAVASFRDNLSAGNYSVLVTDAANCTIEKNIIIETTYSAPAVSLGGTIAGCEGHTLILNAGNENNSYTWSDNSITSSIEVNESGNYHVAVTNEFGCTSVEVVKVIFQVCSGMEYEEKTSSEITLFPNPVRDRVQIRTLNSDSGIALFSITDLSGKIIEEHTNNNTTSTDFSIDLSHLPSGVYFLIAKGDHKFKSLRFCKL